MASASASASASSPMALGVRKPTNVERHALVMFRDANLRELSPKGWREQVVGKGGHGRVYRAEWKGMQVAVKALNMPEVAQAASAEAQEALRAKLTHVAQDFVQEVEVCCDSACAPPGHAMSVIYAITRAISHRRHHRRPAWPAARCSAAVAPAVYTHARAACLPDLGADWVPCGCCS
jgi:hypothetical protein